MGTKFQNLLNLIFFFQLKIKIKMFTFILKMQKTNKNWLLKVVWYLKKIAELKSKNLVYFFKN